MPSLMNSATASGAGFQAVVGAVRDVYSAEIIFMALPNLRFDQFATRKTELGIQPGQQIVIPKFGDVKRGGYLSESNRLETRAMQMSTSNITVQEAGNAIAMTERLIQTSFYDSMAAASMLLGRDMAVVLDMQMRDAARTSTNKVYGGGKASRVTLALGDVFTTTEIHKAVELLETQNAPKWANDFYICFAHPRQLSALRQSAGWVNASHYAGSTPIFFGEIGRYNDVRFISTSMMPNGFNNALNAAGDYADPGFDNALRTGVSGNLTNIFQALIFGEYSYGHAEALPVELRDNGVTDFGREHALAWYAIWGNALLEPNNVVVVETALAA